LLSSSQPQTQKLLLLSTSIFLYFKILNISLHLSLYSPFKNPKNWVKTAKQHPDSRPVQPTSVPLEPANKVQKLAHNCVSRRSFYATRNSCVVHLAQIITWATSIWLRRVNMRWRAKKESYNFHFDVKS
jgi:hypothetical protein